MAFITVSSFFTLFIGNNILFFITAILGFWFYFQLNYANFFDSTLSYTCLFDELSFFIVYITVFVLFISFIYSIYLAPDVNLNLVYSFITIFCIGVFTTNNLFILYFYYECSLLPILYIIVKWGSYPERSLSAVILLIYTSIFTFPFIIVIFTIYNSLGTFLIVSPFTLSSPSLGSLISLIIFFTFAVNLPIYGLHFWLPIAHVEAPTFGSIILAGILLNLGGVGLIRCIDFIDIQFLKTSLIGYLIVYLVYSTLICAFQSDFKRLIAYSSVSHIIVIPLLYLSNTLLSTNSLLIVILFHGLSSPLLFIIVGIVYSIFSTRQLIIVRGLILLSPLLSFIIILAFFFTISAPPFPSFVAEVYLIISCYCLSPFLLYTFLVFTFLSLVYNLNWLTSITFSLSSPSLISFNLTYSSFIPLFLSIIICVPISMLFYII